jgi:RNA polymerase sigma-70 factor, ECF subfamily
MLDTVEKRVDIVSGLDTLVQAQAGNVAAFEKLVSDHRDRVFAVAQRLLRHDADAAEVAQETFLAAYRNLTRFRGEAAFGSWVHRISANFALMRLRRRRTAEGFEGLERDTDLGSSSDAVPTPNAEDLTLDAELRVAIDQATNALAEDYRQVFLLRDIEGLSYEEIATSTGQSLASVKSRLHRARLAMRSSIDKFYSER